MAYFRKQSGRTEDCVKCYIELDGFNPECIAWKDHDFTGLIDKDEPCLYYQLIKMNVEGKKAGKEGFNNFPNTVRRILEIEDISNSFSATEEEHTQQ